MSRFNRMRNIKPGEAVRKYTMTMFSRKQQHKTSRHYFTGQTFTILILNLTFK